MKTPVKYAVVISFAILVSIMAWGTSLLQLDFDEEWLILPGDSVMDSLDIRDKYFDAGGKLVMVYTVDTDFSLEST